MKKIISITTVLTVFLAPALQCQATDRLFFLLGPQISFLTKATKHTAGTLSSGQEVIITETIFSPVNSIAVSVPLEIEYSLGKRIMRRVVDVKTLYCIGLADVSEKNGTGFSKNSTLQIMVIPLFKNMRIMNERPVPGNYK